MELAAGRALSQQEAVTLIARPFNTAPR